MFLTRLLPTRQLSLQARKPTGWIGRVLMTRIFNRGNEDLNNLTLDQLQLTPDSQVLELGFGPGQLLSKMAKVVTTGHLTGLDFSPDMLSVASRANKHAIASGRITLELGDGNNLPFEPDSFDRICSNNTVYFMKVPSIYFSEFARVARPGARICIGFRHAEDMDKLPLENDIFTTYTPERVEQLMTDAGFVDAQTTIRDGRAMRVCVSSARLPN